MPKRAKTDRWISPNTSGYYIHSSDTSCHSTIHALNSESVLWCLPVMMQLCSVTQRRTRIESWTTILQVIWCLHPNEESTSFPQCTYRYSGWYMAMWCCVDAIRVVHSRIQVPGVWSTSWLYAKKPCSSSWNQLSIKSRFKRCTCRYHNHANLNPKTTAIAWHTHTIFDTEYICYDDGCHLRRFARNAIRRDTTTTSKKIADIEIVVDKMHMKGHIDSWCLEHCDSRKITELDHVSYCTYVILQ